MPVNCLDPPAEASPAPLRWSRADYAAIAIVSGVAALLCFYRLGSRAMWQDEGETAVLARSVLLHGVPRARIGQNLVQQDVIGHDRNYLWTFHPWGQFYLAAVSLRLFGNTEWAARAPFALCGTATVGLLYWFVRRNWSDRRLAVLCSLLLATAPAFVLHARQCRYYTLSSLACLGVVALGVECLRRSRWRSAVLFGSAIALQFYADFGTLIGIVPGLMLLVLLVHTGRHSLGIITAGAALGAALCAPGLWLHWERLFARGPAPVDFFTKLGAHFALVDGWMLPLLLPVVAGLRLLATEIGRRKATTAPVRLTAGCLAVLLSAVVMLSIPAQYPHLRYVISQMPLAKLLLGVFVLSIVRRARATPGTPLLSTTIVIVIAGIANWTNLGALPGQMLSDKPYQRTPDFCTKSQPYLRFDGAGLLYELRHDFVSSDLVMAHVISDLARDGDTVLVNYGDLPIMFHWPGLVLRGGLAGGAQPVDDDRRPDLILLPLANGIPFRPYLDNLVASGDYQTTLLRIPETPYGNIPEPRDHWYATPRTMQDFWVLLRRDHLDRLTGIPLDLTELNARWTRPL